MKGVFIITSCTSTRTQEPIVTVDMLDRPATQEEALANWLELLHLHRNHTTTPEELYRGIGMFVVMRIADMIGFDNIRIITGGMGSLKLRDEIVPYDFTANHKHPGNILEVVSTSPFVIPLWWRKINEARFGISNPIADLIGDDNTELVIIGLNKFFLKYLADDLLAADPIKAKKKLRIISVAKTGASVPGSLREMIITYPRDLTEVTLGNRNDLNHRACLHFLQQLKDPEFLQASVKVQRDIIFGMSTRTIVSDSTTQTPQVLKELFLGWPELLKMDPDTAFFEAKRKFNSSYGGVNRFRAVWYELSGRMEKIISEVDDEQTAAASKAMSGIMKQVTLRSSKAVASGDSEVAYKLLHLFVATLKAEMPDAKFSSKEVFLWMEIYCKARKEKIPSSLNGSLS